MRILTIQCGSQEKDLALADLSEAGTLGVSEVEQADGRWRLEACFEDGPEDLAGSFSRYGALVSHPEAVDWVALSRAQWEPLAVGDRFFLVPAWRDEDAPAGRERLVMPPGTASGTGLHAATQLALRGLETILKPGDTVLDLGTGSGILAAAARLLGAGKVVACDLDLDAVSAAREYLQGAALLFAGSGRSLRAGSVDVVVANLSAQALGVTAGDIARVLRPGGRAVVTGFREEATARVARLIAGAGLEQMGALEADGYAAMIAVRAADRA